MAEMRTLQKSGLIKGLTAGLLAATIIGSVMLPAAGATGLNFRSLQLASSTPGATTDYTFTFTIADNATIGSFGVLFCNNDPIETDPCIQPGGLDATNAQLTAQTGITDMNLFVQGENSLILSRTPSAITAPVTVSFTLHNVVNPSSHGPYYARLAEYSSTNATGASEAFGGLAFATTSNLLISTYVPPYLTFCSALTISGLDCSTAHGDYVDFGGLSPTHSSQASSTLLVATNAADGYVMQVTGTTMTSGNNIIAAITDNAPSRPGTAQFGINLRGNNTPLIGSDPSGPGAGQPAAGYNTPDHYRFVDQDVIGSSFGPDNLRKYTVSYVVNVPNDQPPGIYVSTLTYVAAGSF